MQTGISFDMLLFRDYHNKHLKNRNMEKDKYESPSVEILKVEIDQAILTSSFVGENINEWEDM